MWLENLFRCHRHLLAVPHAPENGCVFFHRYGYIIGHAEKEKGKDQRNDGKNNAESGHNKGFVKGKCNEGEGDCIEGCPRIASETDLGVAFGLHIRGVSEKRF